MVESSNDLKRCLPTCPPETSETPFIEGFLSLPWEIIEDICFFLPHEVISDILLEVPSLRPFLIEKYYSREISFELIYPANKGGAWLEDWGPVSHVSGYHRALRFLARNRDIVPNRFVIMSYKRHVHLEALLREHREVLSRAKELDIHLHMLYLADPEDHEHPYDILMSLIFSFPNITLLNSWHSRHQYVPCGPSDSLKELGITSMIDIEWHSLLLPSSLTDFRALVMDADFDNDAFRPEVNDGLFRVFWDPDSYVNPTSYHSRCPNLKSLSLFNCNLAVVDLEVLPPSLERLDMGENKLTEFKRVSPALHWPEGLKGISLRTNSLGDVFLAQASVIGWPSSLETLDLGYNQLVSIDMLFPLPVSLKALVLTANRYTSMQNFKDLPPKLKTLQLGRSLSLWGENFTYNDQGVLHLDLPSSLRDLALDSCKIVAPEEHSSRSENHVLHRIHFPPHLERLEISGCSLTSLSGLVFPVSLKTLRMNLNQIRNLNSYNSWSGPHEVVNWKHLTNLRELHVGCNQIKSLRNWTPPKSLRTLELERNKLAVLSGKSTPLFNDRFHESSDNIRRLNLSANNISEIDPRWSLPRNLKFLNLSRNCISLFEFSNMVLAHENLLELDLHACPLEKLAFGDSVKGRSPTLKVLDLSRITKKYLRMPAKELYEMLERAGFVVNDKSAYIFRRHKFG